MCTIFTFHSNSGPDYYISLDSDPWTREHLENSGFPWSSADLRPSVKSSMDSEWGWSYPRKQSPLDFICPNQQCCGRQSSSPRVTLCSKALMMDSSWGRGGLHQPAGCSALLSGPEALDGKLRVNVIRFICQPGKRHTELKVTEERNV